jgi:ABC-2 type transport system permease protein
MNGALAIARREFRAFFVSPIAYVVIGAFLLLVGFFFFATLFLAGQASMRAFFGMAPFAFVFLVPAITMRALAEERKSGTLELLLTFPMSDWQLTLGKFLASLGMVAVGLLCTLPYALTVSVLTAPGVSFDWGPVFAGYFGLLLLASAFIGLGLWGSALSKNQIVGFLVGLVLCFGFFIVDKFAPLFPEGIGGLLEYLSVDYHFENVARGVLDTRDILFYLSLTAAGLLLTARSVATARQ